jgi:hypothetical protein
VHGAAAVGVKSVNAVCGDGKLKCEHSVRDGGGGKCEHSTKCEHNIVCGGGGGAKCGTVCDAALNLVTKPVGGSINMELRTIHYTLWR